MIETNNAYQASMDTLIDTLKCLNSEIWKWARNNVADARQREALMDILLKGFNVISNMKNLAPTEAQTATGMAPPLQATPGGAPQSQENGEAPQMTCDQGFLAESLFRLPNGDLRTAKQLKVGDQICTVNCGFWDTFVTVTEATALTESPDTMVPITAGTASATLPKDQRIWAQRRNGTGSSVLVKEICLGDEVWTTGGSTQRLDSLNLVTGGEQLIALKFSPDWPIEAYEPVVEAYEPVEDTLLVKGTKPATRRGRLRPNSGRLNMTTATLPRS